MQKQEKIIQIHSNKRPYGAAYSTDSAIREIVMPDEYIRPRRTKEDRIREERRRRWERSVRKHAIQREVRNRYAQANSFSRLEAGIIAGFCVVLLAACSFLLHQESAVTDSVKLNNRLQEEYLMLARENDILDSQIEMEIDHNEIYRYAVEELGMHYPCKWQIVSYERTERGTVYQADDIPNGE